MTGLLAAMAGALAATGLVLMIVGSRRVSERLTSPAGWRTFIEQRIPLGRLQTNRPRWGGPIAVSFGAIVWLLSGWPAAGLIATAIFVGLPVLLSTSKVAARSIDRVEAVEEWARRLSDVLMVGVGLEQAVIATVRTCPEPVREEVSALSARLAARWPTEAALRAFADDLDDATGDLIAAL